MIRINLLPVREERRKADLRQFAVLLVATFAGSVAVAGFFHWSVKGEIESTRVATAQTQKQIDQFASQLEKVQQYRETKAQIEKKLEVIERLDESRSGPVHVLDELATHTPERLWVTRVQAQGGRISIHGMSLDNELVALFLTSLNESAYFRDVELEQTEAREKNGFKLNEFQLNAALSSPSADAPATPGASPGQAAAGAPAGRRVAAAAGQR